MPNGPAFAPHPRLPRHDPPRPRPDARRRRERRLCRRLAHGLTPAQAAAAEGAPEAEVRALLADPDFAALADAYRQLCDQPEARQRDQLRQIARLLLMQAVIDGDMRAACFVFREEARRRDPAATLADGVIRAARRPVESPASAVSPAGPPPAGRPPAPRPPADPVDRAAWRTAADLRDAIMAEHAALHRATTAEPAVAEPTPATPRTAPAPKADPAAPRFPAPAAPARNRHERRRLAALRRGRAERAGGPGGNRGPPR